MFSSMIVRTTEVSLQCLGGRKPRLINEAFSLVEMLAVIGIVSAVMGMLGVGIAQLTAQSARKSAVNLVLNTFEQARVAALRSGTNVYVAFANADPNFPEDSRYRSFVFYRDRTENDSPAASVSSDPVFLTKWKKLPRGISFKSSAGLLSSGGATRTLSIPGGGTVDVPVLKFNATGAVGLPSTGDIRLYLYEGYHDGTNDRITINSTSDLFETFSFARFTGRIRHEVTAFNGS